MAVVQSLTCVWLFATPWSAACLSFTTFPVSSISCPLHQRCHRLEPTMLLHPWDFPGKNMGVGCCSLLQETFSTQGSNLGLLHCRQILYHLSQLEAYRSLELPNWGEKSSSFMLSNDQAAPARGWGLARFLTAKGKGQWLDISSNWWNPSSFLKVALEGPGQHPLTQVFPASQPPFINHSLLSTYWLIS